MKLFLQKFKNASDVLLLTGELFRVDPGWVWVEAVEEEEGGAVEDLFVRHHAVSLRLGTRLEHGVDLLPLRLPTEQQ